MRYVEVNGSRISAIGLGTWQFGSREWGYGSEYAGGEALAITRRALDLGINLIDTAEMYAFGRSERIVGQAIAGRRGEAFVATKIAPVLPFAPVVERRGAGSARRLGVDRIDLYQAHWPNPVVRSPASLMAGMRTLQERGTVAAVGVSNYGLGQWRAAEVALGGPVLSNQVQYNLVQRRPDEELVPWAQANDRLVIAYSPLAQGFLSGRYSADHRPGGVRSVNPLFLAENLDRAAPLLGALHEVAVAHDATPSQIALAWLVRKPNVVVIPGASSVAQLEANAAAADIELSDEEDAVLVSASDAFEPRGGPGVVPDLVRARIGR
jgi:aryl-alcohol dehydrogenase-like predicted oxidoreductase